MRIPSLAVLVVSAWLAAALAAGGEPPPLPTGQSLGTTRPPPPPALFSHVPEIDIRGQPTLGDAAAPVTIVEFIDYECPYCQHFAKTTFRELRKDYIDTGKVRYVARDFPLPKHDRARPGAIAAACAGEQGRFWEMHEALLTSEVTLTDDVIAALGSKLVPDRPKFEACRGAEARHAARLDADVADGRVLGVGATPSFLIGASAGDIARGRLIEGDEGYAAFAKYIAEVTTRKGN